MCAECSEHCEKHDICPDNASKWDAHACPDCGECPGEKALCEICGLCETCAEHCGHGYCKYANDFGGTFEKCALMAKKALARPVDQRSEIPYVREMEEELLEKINCSGIGPGGLGGSTTALAVNINTYPTHIAGLPVGINICCHVNRHAVRVI